MRIVIDARWIIPQPSGIGIYTRELLARLPKIEPEWQFRALFGTPELAEQTVGDIGLEHAPNLMATVLPYGVFSPAGQVRLPFQLRRWECDLFHSTNYMIPHLAFPRNRCGRIRCVATIHDVIPLIMPDHAPKSLKSRLHRLFVLCLRESVARSDAILSVSEASRRDILRTLRLGAKAAERVQVAYNGADKRFNAVGRRPIATDAATPRILLYVGRLDPYKNVVKLVEAFAQARLNLAFPLQLLLVGPPDPRYPEAMNRARELGVADGVRLTGFVSPAGLAETYRSADLLVHPSRYEGFGLQLVEAMRSGLPVLCTDGGAQPEVAGDAAVVVPAGDVSAMASAIVELLRSPSRLQDLQQRGLRRSLLFDWNTAARKVADVYRALLSQ